MQKITYYEVYKNSDSIEGRGSSVTVVRFKEKFDATHLTHNPEFVKRHGVMGTSSGIGVSEKTIHIYDSYVEYDAEHGKEQLRRIALAKLTEEDKRVLGLKD